jgi:hypothetical protein
MSHYRERLSVVRCQVDVGYWRLGSSWRLQARWHLCEDAL